MSGRRSSIATVFVIGGGIGSGKSAFGKILSEFGGLLIESDRIGHDVLEPSGAAFSDVAARWPVAVKDGVIDRATLGSIVFSDEEQLAELEAVTHPAIRRRIEELIERADAPVVLEVPVLVPFVEGDDVVHVFIDSSRDLRLERAVARGGGEADVRRRMLAQAARDEWLAWADRVIDNSGSPERLRVQARELWQEFVPGPRDEVRQ